MGLGRVLRRIISDLGDSVELLLLGAVLLALVVDMM